MKHILAIDDETDILQLISYHLKKEGYSVTCVESGEAALQQTAENPPDLILLDLMLPGVDGMEVCRTLKSDPQTKNIPIIMLTARDEEFDMVMGLEMGADDYMTKPFSPRVLLARVKAVLRRSRQDKAEPPGRIRIHNLLIDRGKHLLFIDDIPLKLTWTEFEILYLLAGRPGWVYSRYQIVNALRGEDYPVTERAIDVQIVGLRKKMGAAGNLIETVRGVGYRMKE